ncbi:MAG TPA: acyl carrier protein [Solirubrobacteraceae bacterium]|jgi:acyl carrier protein|nr:acyl carrier protein [Solirubrobacteraceae bacterium]
MSATTEVEVQECVFESLATFGSDPESITREATLEDLDIDSLDLAELTQIVEDRFGVEIKGSDVATVVTVGDAIDLIVSRLP